MHIIELLIDIYISIACVPGIATERVKKMDLIMKYLFCTETSRIFLASAKYVPISIGTVHDQKFYSVLGASRLKVNAATFTNTCSTRNIAWFFHT